MNYELYCYKSKLFIPELTEAYKIIKEENAKSDSGQLSYKSNSIFKIIVALRKFNPKLDSCFRDGYNKIESLKKTRGDQIILNTPKGEISTQIKILDSFVLISVPFLYSSNKAKQVFEQVNEYTKIIRLAVNYFVYDPQTDKVYDPFNQTLNDLSIYIEIFDRVTQQKLEIQKLRSWWKFW